MIVLDDADDNDNASGAATNAFSGPQFASGWRAQVVTRTARAIAVATSHACAVVDDGTVRCWGRPSGGVLGVSYHDPREMDPVVVPGVAGVRALAADRSRTCAVHEDAAM